MRGKRTKQDYTRRLNQIRERKDITRPTHDGETKGGGNPYPLKEEGKGDLFLPQEKRKKKLRPIGVKQRKRGRGVYTSGRGDP